MIEATNLKAKPEQHCIVVIKQHKHATRKRRMAVYPILAVDLRQVKQDGTVWIQTDKFTAPYQAHKLNTPKITENSAWIRAERIVQHVDIAEHGSDLDWDQINAMYDELEHRYGWVPTAHGMDNPQND